jgi:hypothetical protein
LTDIDAQVDALLDAAVAECEDEPMPPALSALDGVLANPARAELEWYRRSDG